MVDGVEGAVLAAEALPMLRQSAHKMLEMMVVCCVIFIVVI